VQKTCAATPVATANQQGATTRVSIVDLLPLVEDVVALGVPIPGRAPLQLQLQLHRRLLLPLRHHLEIWWIIAPM